MGPKKKGCLTVHQLINYYEKELGRTLYDMETMSSFTSKEFTKKTLYAERCEVLMALFETIEYKNEKDQEDSDGPTLWFLG